MAWWAEIGGVDQTANIDRDAAPVHLLKLLNERWVATFVCMPGFTPPRRTEVIFYGKDGVTPIYGGLVSRTKRWASGPLLTHQHVEVIDFRAYADVAYTAADFGYTSPVTLLQILQDLVVYLAPFGITLDPSQPTGPTFAPFAWPVMRLSDGFRALTDATGGQYVYQISPAKVLSMTVPGSVSAPWSITDAAPHCTDLRVVNRDQNYADHVILVCGPTGVGSEAFTQTWTGIAATFAYALSGVNVPASHDWPGVVQVSSADLVINGAFTTDLSGWTAGANWAWSSGAAAHSAGSTEPLAQTIACGVGWHRIVFSATITAGSLAVTFGGLAVPTSGTDIYVDAPPCDLVITPSADFVGTIDNIQVLPMPSYPLWLPGEAPGGNGIEWDYATAGGTLSFLGTAQGLIVGGEVIALTYYPQYPFVVTADAGVTPPVKRKFTRADLLTFAAAQETADGLLDQLYQEPEELEIDTQDDGLEPGQALPVSTTAPLAVSMTALVTSVDVTLQDDDTWLYLAQATESAVYQQATQPLVYFRSLTGGGSSGSATVISGGGSAPSFLPPFSLGGSREDPYPVGTTPTPVISWQPFRAPANLSATVFATLRAKAGGVTVTPVLQRWDSGSGTWVTHTTGSGVTSTSETDQEFTVALTAGQIVRLAYYTNTAGASAYAISQLRF